MAVIDTTKPPKVSTRPAKVKVVEEVSTLLDKSSMVFSLPSAQITGNQMVALRKGLPDGCTAKVVKNKLMRIACKGSQFEGVDEVTTGENMWMFVEGEDNLAEPIKYIAEFAKQFDKDSVSSSWYAGVGVGARFGGYCCECAQWDEGSGGWWSSGCRSGRSWRESSLCVRVPGEKKKILW